MSILRSLAAVIFYFIVYFAVVTAVTILVFLVNWQSTGTWFYIVGAFAALLAGIGGVAAAKFMLDRLFASYSKLAVATSFIFLLAAVYIWELIVYPDAFAEFEAGYINGLLRDALACVLTWGAFFRGWKIPD